MFPDRHLLLRLAAAALPPRLGYRLTARSAGWGAAERIEWVEATVEREATRLLGDPLLARAAAADFAAAIACDDLDALTALAWPRSKRLRHTSVEGLEHLPPPGPAVFVSFHLSGGFRVFDVLGACGFRPTFVLAEGRPLDRLYLRALDRARRRFFRRSLDPAWIATGRGARARLEEHLRSGGCAVALLDVAPAVLGLRDEAPATLFGRPLRLPVGLLRIAERLGAPVIPFDGRIEGWRRVLRFHAPARSGDAEACLASVLATFERVIRERPEAWQGWLDVERFFANGAAEESDTGPGRAAAATRG